jgi:hypothetical protein
LRSLHKRFSESRNPQGGAAEAETRRAAGRGVSTERVTEGEQGKYRRDGSLRKPLYEGHLHKDTIAAGQHLNYCLSPAAYAGTRA